MARRGAGSMLGSQRKATRAIPGIVSLSSSSRLPLRTGTRIRAGSASASGTLHRAATHGTWGPLRWSFHTLRGRPRISSSQTDRYYRPRSDTIGNNFSVLPGRLRSGCARSCLIVTDGSGTILTQRTASTRRIGDRSTIITSQLPPAQWHDYLADATLADAICDRILHNAHRIVLKGTLAKEGGQARRLTTASVASLRSRSSDRRDHDGPITASKF